MLRGRAAVVKLVGTDGLAVARVASQVGVSFPSVARVIDAQCNIARDRRPRIVGTTLEDELRTLLEQGRGRGEISATLRIRRSFIKDYLAQQPDLRCRWERANFDREREKHRAQLLATLEAHPELPVKTIRRLPHNGFQWLYNHDREWLQEVLPAIWKR